MEVTGIAKSRPEVCVGGLGGGRAVRIRGECPLPVM